jgi:hypothetical protein
MKENDVPVTIITLKKPYGLLETLASIFSAFSVLLLMYKSIMGDFRLSPFGWMQKRLLWSTTDAFIERINRNKQDDEWLQDVLFSFFIDGNGLYATEEGIVNHLLRRLRSKREHEHV